MLVSMVAPGNNISVIEHENATYKPDANGVFLIDERHIEVVRPFGLMLAGEPPSPSKATLRGINDTLRAENEQLRAQIAAAEGKQSTENGRLHDENDRLKAKLATLRDTPAAPAATKDK